LRDRKFFAQKSALTQLYLGRRIKILKGDASLQHFFLFKQNVQHSIYRLLNERDSFINWTFIK